MSGRKGNLASRSLEYRAPEVPNFLKTLKAQVASSDRYARPTSTGGDQLDSFVSSTSSAGKRKARDDEQDQDHDLDSEDEMNGAQVVVLKDGKHLSHDEALNIKAALAKQEQAASASSHADSKPQNIATSGGPAKKKRDAVAVSDGQKHVSISSIVEASARQKGGKKESTALEDVKQLIKKHREARATHNTKAKETRENKQTSKEQERREKNAQAKKLKAKAGKGLSFDLDDD